MKIYLSKLAVLFFAVAFAALFYPDTAFADNPIVQNIYTADPAPMVYGDTLYVYTTHDEDDLIDDFYTMLEWKCYSTKDMVNWTDHGTVLSKDSFTWAEDRAWAAQCVERDGKFYLYVPLHKKNGGMVIGVGVSDSPTGPFEDAIGKPLVDEGDWNDIDPTVYIDDDGQAYLYFGNPQLRYVELNEDMISYDKEVGVQKIDMTVESFGEGRNETSPSYAEGPWFYKRNNLYYMVYPAFGPTGGEYIAYSTSESPTGPWEYRGTIMPFQGNCFTNHPGVVDFKGHSYFFYHNQALPGGGSYHRSVCLEEFTYNEDGTFPEINMTKDGPDAISELNPYNRVEAETFAWGTNVETQDCAQGGINVYDIKNGSILKIKEIDFGEKGAIKFHASVASEGDKGAEMELHLDSEDGTLIGKLSVSDTGGADEYKIFSTDVESIAGVHDLYIVFKGDSEEELMKFDYWQFEKEPEPVPTQTPAPSPSSKPILTGTPAPTTESLTPKKKEVETPKLKVSKVKGVVVKAVKGKKAKLTWKKVKGAVKYEIIYSMDKKMKKGKKKAISKKTEYKIKKLKKGKKYYVKIRACQKDESGKVVYGSYSTIKKFKVK